MENEKVKVWVTKYALSSGVEYVDAEVCHRTSSSMIAYKSGEHSCYAHGKDWHRTREEAVVRVAEMRKAKIASLKKSLAKLEAMDVVVPQ